MIQPPLPAWYLRKRQAVEAYFVPENRVEGSETVSHSPDGRFRLVVTNYRTRPNCIGFARGDLFESERKVLHIDRNIVGFPFAWVKHPANGHTYLLCGEDYQGQTVIDCDTGEMVVHIPAAAEQGFGFCWAAIHPNPADPSLLAVEGCVWAAPYDVLFVRLHPDGGLEELARAGEADFGGWQDGGRSARLKREIEVVKSTGKPTRELSGPEEEAHEARAKRFFALSMEERRTLSKARCEEMLDETTLVVEETWDVGERLGVKL